MAVRQSPVSAVMRIDDTFDAENNQEKRLNDMSIKINDLTVTFKNKVTAINHADLEIPNGVFGLLGENGAGKSTLIKCLGACQSYDSGAIYLEKKKMTAVHPKQAIEAGIGIVFQELSLIPNLSVADNLFLGMNLGNKLSVTRRKTACSKARQIFKEFEVEGIEPETKVEALSLSEKQTLEIVKVLSRDTQVVVFDEATSALSSDRVEWLYHLVKRLQEKKKIIIFISHRMGEIRRFCNIVTVFRNGENVGTHRLDEVDNDRLVHMMLGRKMSGYYPEKISTVRDVVVLETKGLHFEHYLEHVDLTLRMGEVVGIGGLAGQGQNALLLALSGAVQAQKGKIVLGGKETRLKTPGKAMAEGISLVPEERATEGLILDLSIADNLLLPVVSKITRLGLISRKKEKQLLTQAVESLAIKAGDIENPVNSLSGGNQQKVILGRWMEKQVKLFILDEPTRGIDVRAKGEIYKLIRDMADSGITVIVISSEIEELLTLADRIMIMNGGKVKGFVVPNEDMEREDILKVALH